MQKSIDELIFIANGGKYSPEVVGRSKWYSIKKIIKIEEQWEYQYQDQLSAIIELGESKNIKALEFLQYISESKIDEITYANTTKYGQGSGDCNPYTIELYHRYLIFPHAKGPIAKKMKIILPSDQEGGREWKNSPSENEIQIAINEGYKMDPLRTIESSIKKLIEVTN